MVARLNAPPGGRDGAFSASDVGRPGGAGVAKRIRARLEDSALAAVARITNGLTDSELDTFIKVMDVMAQNMDANVDLLAIARTLSIRKSVSGHARGQP